MIVSSKPLALEDLSRIKIAVPAPSPLPTWRSRSSILSSRPRPCPSTRYPAIQAGT